MKFKLLGSTGLAVSRLSFGAMTFGQGQMVPGVINNIDQTQADNMVSRALEAGVNLFDTADAYTGGQSEEILGKALRNHRQDVLISTKCGFRTGASLIQRGLSYRHIVQSIESSLKRLQTDYIDIYFLHIPDPYTPLEETARALEDMRLKGYIRYSGVSNFSAWKVAKFLGVQTYEGYARLAVTQMYYSLLGRDLEHDFVPFLEDANLGLMVWSPLSSGYLSGKYTGQDAGNARRKDFKFPPIDTSLGDKIVYKLKEIAEHYDATASQVAIAWLLSKPYVTTVIIGANNDQQLEDNLKSSNLKLSEEEISQLDDISASPAPYPAWMQPMGYDSNLVDALKD